MLIFSSNGAKLRQSLWYMSMYIYLGIGSGVFGAVVAKLAAQTGVGKGDFGFWFLPAGGLGYLVGTLIAGRLFDRLQAHRLLGVALIASALLSFSVPLVGSLAVLVAINFAKGAIDSMIGTSPNTLLNWMHGERSEPYINALHFFWGLGAFLGPFFAALFIDLQDGYRIVYWILAAYALLLGLRFLPMRNAPTRVEAKKDGAGARAKVPWAIVAFAALTLFFYVSSELCYGNWAGNYSQLAGLLDEKGAAFLLSAFWAAFTFGRFLSIQAARMWKPQTVLATCIVACIAISTLPIVMPGSTAALWASTIGFGLFMAPIWPSAFNLASRSLVLTATISSIIFLGDSLGGLVLPSITGKVQEAASDPRAMIFLIGGSLCLLLLAFFGMLWARKRHSAAGA